MRRKLYVLMNDPLHGARPPQKTFLEVPAAPDDG
jgi:hypothetical protein